MCGLIAYHGSKINKKKLLDILPALEHRGPDDSGIYLNPNGQVALGHRRLSIIDLEGGEQPMVKDGLALVFNGEIYNYPELRRQLKNKGHKFKTNSDTEVLLESYREWGAKCLQKFRGMFAFVLRDEHNNLTFMARDRFGQKPLLYSKTDQNFVVASEFQALLKFPEVSRRLNIDSVPLYLGLQYIPSPVTGFEAIKKLQPAHYLVVKDSTVVENKKYWELDYSYEKQHDFKSASQQLRKRIERAIEIRMRSDVPLGAFLSGGIDSSIIVSQMAKLANQPVKSFTIGFDYGKSEELNCAEDVANRYGSDHEVYRVTPDVQDLLPKIVRHYGEPFADSSAIPVYYVARETSQKVKVALTGDGGDELFGGYGLYQKLQSLQNVAKWLPNLMRGGISRLFNLLPAADQRRDLLSKAILFLQHLNSSPAEWHYFLASYFTSEQLKQVLATDSLDYAVPKQFFQETYEKLTGPDTFAGRGMAFDARTYLPDDLQVKVDIASMMSSLECRSPFLDHKLAEFAAGLPLSYKMGPNNKSKKHILKKAFCKDLPDSVLEHKKTGFGIPRARWVREDLSEHLKEILLESGGDFHNLFNRKYIKKLFTLHQQKKGDYDGQLWALMMFRLWMKEFEVHL